MKIKCGKCGSTDNYGGCFLGDDFYVYDFGCEDCDNFVNSSERPTYSEAMDEALSLFVEVKA